MASGFDPKEAEEFLRTTVTGLFMNRDIGSVSSAVGALRAIAAGFATQVKDPEQIAKADEWAETRGKSPDISKVSN